MEKELGSVKFTETDDGFRIEVTGKTLKEMMSGCCMPFGFMNVGKDGCCGPSEEKEE
ncbi:MAG: hypothetical protein JSU65_03095 [Candidatus Zixiibacteriota bacterium]|nr:MAG: hypothetical protein JSU65_03095 [candidate division Zixibacteria bacterium]